jgi:DMSO/TMAO reductase YedYZ molybdopterin-dependent catalytic subunit
LKELYALPEETQITRHICVEGWSAIGKWSGTRLSEIPAPGRCRSHREICLVPLRRGLSHLDRHATALHPQTQMTFKFDGEILPTKYGFPMKVRMPTKLGFKNPKHVMEMAVINNWNPGYWEEKGYNWFSGS